MSEKTSVGFTTGSIALGCLLAPLTLALAHLIQTAVFSLTWSPWVYLLVAPYGLAALAALPHLIARGITGRWPWWPWLLLSFPLTGGLAVTLAGLILGISPGSALKDGLVYGGFCLLMMVFFLAIAVDCGRPPLLRRYIEWFDHNPPLPLGPEHPVRKGWYELDAVDRHGRLLWYKPPSSTAIWLRKAAFVTAVFFLSLPIAVTLGCFTGRNLHAGKRPYSDSEQLFFSYYTSMFQYRPTRYPFVLIVTVILLAFAASGPSI